MPMGGRELAVVFDDVTDPERNLETEELIFERVQRRTLPEVLRFWRSTECLVRGRARSARYGWYDEKLAAELKVPVYERSTGGGVIYMDLGNLNWSFYLRSSGEMLAPAALFGRWSAHLVGALRRVGLDARFAPPNRIDVSGSKVSGMAARSTSRGFMVHGTLLVDTDLSRLNSLCIPPAGCPPVSNLREWRPDSTVEEAEELVVKETQVLGFEVRRSKLELS